MAFQRVEDESPYYVWESKTEHYFKGCDQVKVFTMSMNLYLKACTKEQLKNLLSGEYFLRIEMYEQGTERQLVDRIRSTVLTISGLNDEKYKTLMKACPSDMVPCEIKLGPFWHFLGINRIMCEMRDVGLGFVTPVGYIMGTQLFGRDAYPGETEEDIRRVEEGDEIFIRRKSD